MSNSHKPHLAVPTERGSIHRIWQLNGRVKWQCSRSKHQYFVCLVVHSIYQRIVLNLWFGRSRGYSKLWEFFRNLKVDSLLEYSTLGWAHKYASSRIEGQTSLIWGGKVHFLTLISTEIISGLVAFEPVWTGSQKTGARRTSDWTMGPVPSSRRTCDWTSVKFT